jgi:hypothetical protein
MIVDDADMEIEMAEDPFLEAGITAPPILPYQGSISQNSVSNKLIFWGFQRPLVPFLLLGPPFFLLFFCCPQLSKPG